MKRKAAVYTISQKALKREKQAMLKEFLKADKDPGDREIRQDFADIEGEGFIEIEDFDFEVHED